MASWVVLICAICASLTGGVALAYGVCAGPVYGLSCSLTERWLQPRHGILPLAGS